MLITGGSQYCQKNLDISSGWTQKAVLAMNLHLDNTSGFFKLKPNNHILNAWDKEDKYRFLAWNPCNYMHLNLLPPDYCGGLLCAVAWSTFFGGAIGNIPTFFTLPMTVIIVSDLLSDITLLLCHQFTIECFETETLWPKRVNRNVILGSLKHWAGDSYMRLTCRANGSDILEKPKAGNG